jgi:tetratricopeptide (TPR) repeat protein
MKQKSEVEDQTLLKIWSLYSSEQFQEAERELTVALEQNSDDFELLYAYALVAKKSSTIEKAIEAFRQIVDRTDSIDDETRRAMLRRIAAAHINHLESGQWNADESGLL